ncbi:DNA repair protein RecO [Alteromonas sp. a30]|uniref:DNA repair protein RecO n=1 Tax=Alteromonas sp. a30 TaxID=2730917 RepID=UPI002281B055|nr:DNA repair protein RecO [Alteromonas sp. a30]MCY7294295.1 DNA repair protein RecO [Alteromonas sp. a30]
MAYNRGESRTANVYVLHSRPYRDTSAIVTCLSQEFGKLSFIAKGIRAKKNAKIALLQPFIPLSVCVFGNNELKNLASVEALSVALTLTDNHLYSALYANELLVRLLPPELTYPALFEHYQQMLHWFSEQKPIEPILREFELSLLNEFGYGIDLQYDVQNDQPVIAEGRYTFDPEIGVTLVENSQSLSIPGQLLLDVSEFNWHPASLKTAKYMNRLALGVLLGNKPLKSRELFNKPQNTRK